jgi:hypothetical protein
MNTRELYKQKFEAQMHEWRAKLDVMTAQAEKLTAQAKIEVQPHLDAVQAKFDDAKAKLKEIAAAGDDKWDDVVKAADQGWRELRNVAEGAQDALHQKKPD